MKRKVAGFGLAVIASVALMAGRANASVIFSDNFDANPTGLNATPAGWTVTSGTVDIVGTAFFANLCTDQGGSPSPARCIDMDGSTNAAGTMHTNAVFSLVPGPTYTVSFWFSGNDRNGSPDSMNVTLDGTTLMLINVPSNTPWQLASFNVNVLAPTSASIIFAHQGGDNIGILVDNVTLSDNLQSAVPEPMSLTLLGSGLIGAALRRRRQNRAA